MTTPWTLQALEDAKNKHQFIMVTPIGLPRVSIVNAQMLWTRNPDIIFQTGYRIAGTKQDITNTLLPLGVNEADLQNLFDTAITVENYNTSMAPVYKEELDAYNTWKRAVLKSNISSPGAKLFDIMASVNPDILLRTQTTTGTKVVKVATTLGIKGKGRAVQPLIDKINNLPQGKVLDVSTLEPDGKGTKAINPPVRSKKYGSPNIPMVSSDLEHYILAINMLPGGQERYAADIEYVRKLFEQVKTEIILPPTTPVAPGPTFIVPSPTRPILPTPKGTTITEGIPVPQTEIITPTMVAPLYTKAQRKKKKAAAVKAQILQPIVPISGEITPTQPITPFPVGITPTQAITPFPVGITPTQPVTPIKTINPLYEEEEPSEEELSEEEEPSDEEISEEEISEEELSPTIPLMTPQIPTVTPKVPTMAPVMPTVTPKVTTMATVMPTVTPKVPTITPIIPTVTPGVTRTPTFTTGTSLIPGIPRMEAVGTPTIQRTSVIPQIPTTPTIQRTPIIPQIPTTPKIQRTPIIPQIPTTPTIQRTPVIPNIQGKLDL